MTKTIVVIPAYNEAETLGDMLQQVCVFVPDIIVVDDGSSDQTPAIAKAAGATVLTNSQNLGKGLSLQRGLTEALVQGADAVITMDADLQHNPADLPRFLEAAVKFPTAVIIGARLRSMAKTPRARRIANAIADFWISWAGGQAMKDTQSGFRLYPASLLQKIDLNTVKTWRFAYEADLLISASQAGAACIAIPIDRIYPVNARASYFRPFNDIMIIIWAVALRILRKGLHLNGLFYSLCKKAKIYGRGSCKLR